MMGERLGKYEITGLLGKGATARVFLARDLHLDIPVAIKAGGEEFLPAEMELLKGLEHPGLPKIYDYFKENEKTCLVMEYVDGVSLRKYLKRHGRIGEQQAVNWCLQLCGILSYLHQRRPPVIYRDLKPENIMIRPDGSLKLIDLGGAARAAFGKEKEELLAGTPGYCPPEQWERREADCRMDIYAAGAVLHEMLTGVNPGKPPFERRPAREYDRSISGGVERFLQTCLQPDPAKRYASMEEAAAELGKCGKGDKGKWRLPGLRAALRTGAAAFAVLFTVIPLLKGVEHSRIPFPFLYRPLFFLAVTVLLQCLPGRKRRFGIRRMEKSLCLTEKQFPGLYGLFYACVGISVGLLLAGASPLNSRAVEGEERLWVEMRDEQNRKLLLKEGTAYTAKTAVRLEIPADRIPEGKMALQLVAVGEEGNLYSSRIFYIETP